jgi:integrase
MSDPHSSEDFPHTSSNKIRSTTAQAEPRYAKTDVRFWRTKIFHPVYSRGGRKHASATWAVQMEHRGVRHRWSLYTANKAVAAARARDIFLSVLTAGWEATLAKYRAPGIELTESRDITVGQYIELVRAKADGNPKTLEAYAKAFRTIVAAVCEIDSPKKYDYCNGGHRSWLEAVEGVPLSAVTPAQVQDWKKRFLGRAGDDPIAQRRAKVSVNSLLRSTRSLFSSNIRRHLGVELPAPLPFEGVELEGRQSVKYRSNFDAVKLIRKAKEELQPAEPEQFKVFLLALTAGLRRKEIDLLEWDSFKWETGILRVQPTRYFQPKSEDSIGDVHLDPEVADILRSYQSSATSRFVIESSCPPRPGAMYRHYRAQQTFEQLTHWLRERGVNGTKPLHTLRKEFGSQICALHGIFQASRSLRHADIRITNETYTDSVIRSTSGLGRHLQ